MDHIKKDLAKRLLIITGLCFLAESVLSILVREVLLPAAASLARFESTHGTLELRDFLEILRTLVFGDNQVAVMGIFTRSGAFLLLLLSAVLLLLPYLAGVVIAANIAAAQFEVLQKEREAEHAAYEEKRNLMISDFAHDLRTPIMTITGYARALSDHMVEDPAMQAEYLDAIRRKSERVSELINLLFDFARLGSTNYKLTLGSCDMNELALETAAALYTDAEEAGMEFNIMIPEEPYSVQADRAQAGRIFTNLITNAIRHNPQGTEIAVIGRRLAGVEYIAVADTGRTIEGDTAKLFDPFVKGDASRTGDKGSGLGLSISKKIAELHGWELTLQQPYEKYTKAFVLCIPED